MIYRKEYLEKIKPYIGLDVIKVLTGLRRSGKSVILSQIKEWITEELDAGAPSLLINLEDGRNSRFLEEGVLEGEINALLDVHPGRKVYVFLDEIQEVPQWERAVNSLRTRPNADIYITGSNSKLLSGELATYITGRYKTFTIYPFSFREFQEAVARVNAEADKVMCFNLYLQQGGMPFLTNLGYREELSMDYLGDLYNSILLKDVVQRHEIRDVDLLNRLVKYIMSSVGHVFSAQSISRYLKSEKCSTTVGTVLNYLRACEEAFLLKRVEREDVIGKKILRVDEKYYVADIGLRRAVTHGSVIDDIDQLLENIVYYELCRRNWHVTVGRVKTQEVDFVCEKGNERLYVQVSYMMPTAETREREFGALLTIPDQYDKLVLSMDTIDMSRSGIRHLYLPDFLLS